MRISIHQYNVDSRWCIGMGKSGMRKPIYTRDFLSVELNFLVERAAHGVEHGALHCAAQRFRVDHQSAVVPADQALDPDVAGLPVDFHLGDLRNHGLAAECVRDPTSGEKA